MESTDNPKFLCVAKTLSGLETVLADELTALGAEAVKPTKRAVEFAGDVDLLYRANYELRTALRILVPIHRFRAGNERNFYDGIRQIDWSEYMTNRDSLAIDTIATGEIFKHSHYLGLLAKDAIVDQFRDRTGRRPDVNTVSPTLRIHVRADGGLCDISLDSSGSSLHMRGYRRDSVEAPLNEVLAAGMIRLSGWQGDTGFVDPMCGSGTLPIEAAMMACRIPPQQNRESFGFQRWPDYDEKRWFAVKKAADDAVKPIDFKIHASDIDSRARNAATLNILTAGLEKHIHIEKMAFEKLAPPEASGHLIMNPPYDERLKVYDTSAFYALIGDTMKKNWPGWQAWLISSNRDALKSVGLRPSRRITLFNGPLECSFQQFDLYEGKKTDAESTPDNDE